MSTKKQPAHSLPKAPSFVEVDAACNHFEAEWKAGRAARIEDYLTGWEEPERSKLLYELVDLEVTYRLQRGENPSLEEHESRFNDSRHVVQEVYRQRADDGDTQCLSQLHETLIATSELTGIQFHAEGGLGIVYTAEDRQLKRNVAVKFIHDRVVRDPASRTRFLLEAEVTSRLEHPGVVPVHGLGQTEDGRPFYLMRFITGETLDDAIRRYHECSDEAMTHSERDLQFRELLQRFVAVCQTIAYSHNRGIIHRDIKPVNIMLGRYGETVVVDWGLAVVPSRWAWIGASRGTSCLGQGQRSECIAEGARLYRVAIAAKGGASR